MDAPFYLLAYIVTRAKKTAIDQGGEIVHESKLIKSITFVLRQGLPFQMLTTSSVKFPADKVHAMESNDAYTVEADQVVKAS